MGNHRKRKSYAAILDKSTSLPGSESTNTVGGGKIIEAQAGEAEAVAKALGLITSVATRKGKEADRGDAELETVKESVLDENIKSSQMEGERNDDQSEDEEEEDDDEEEDEDDDEDSDGSVVPQGIMFAEGGGIEQMPNYVGGANRDLDKGVENKALNQGDRIQPADSDIQAK